MKKLMVLIGMLSSFTTSTAFAFNDSDIEYLNQEFQLGDYHGHAFENKGALAYAFSTGSGAKGCSISTGIKNYEVVNQTKLTLELGIIADLSTYIDNNLMCPNKKTLMKIIHKNEKSAGYINKKITYELYN